jgi:Holliday junction resolvase
MKQKYRKGADFERKLVKEAREKGFIAARTAGSKSKIDCFEIDYPGKLIRFIQAKKGKSRMTKQEIIDFEGMSDEYMVKFEVIQQ